MKPTDTSELERLIVRYLTGISEHPAVPEKKVQSPAAVYALGGVGSRGGALRSAVQTRANTEKTSEKKPTRNGWFFLVTGGDGWNRTTDLWVMNPSL